MQKDFKTILTEEEIDDHPITYFNERNYFLEGLSQKYSNQIKFPNVDIKRNPRFHHYLHQYENQKKKMERISKQNQSYLSSQQFTPIFSDQILENRNRVKQLKEEEKLRRDLEKMYLQQQQAHQEPEKDHEEEQQEGRTILIDYRSDVNKKKQLYLLDLEIGRLKFEDKIEKEVKNKIQGCNNGQLLGKMSKNILSAYMVHFDEVFAALIDEVLSQEVSYLNYMEAKYHVEKAQEKYPSNEYENMKTIQMMDLVKELDQLATQ